MQNISAAECSQQDFTGPWGMFVRMDHWLHQVEKVCLWLSGLVIFAIFVIMIGSVFLRQWSSFLYSVGMEGAKMGMWPMGFLGAAYIWRHYGHVRFDLVLRSVSFRNAQWIELANSVVVFVVAVFMTLCSWVAFSDVYLAKSRTGTLHLQYWPMFWTSFVGAGLLVLETAFSIVRHWREARYPTGKEVAPWHIYDKIE